MNSFIQHIERKKNLSLAETAFGLMVKNGIDPMLFLEWYAQEGILLSENKIGIATTKWLKREMRLHENLATGVAAGSGAVAGGLLGGPVGAGVGAGLGTAAGSMINRWAQSGQQQQEDPAKSPAVQNALKAMDNLSRNMPQHLGQKNNFVQSLHSLIANLRNPISNVVPGAAPAAAPGPQQPAPAPAPAPVAVPAAVPAAPGPAPLATPGWNPIRRPAGEVKTSDPNDPRQEEANLNRVFIKMANRGVNPRVFVEWYVKEGRHSRNFREDFGDFLSQTASGVGSWMGGDTFVSGYRGERDKRNQRRQNDAIATAKTALKELQKYIQTANLGQEMNQYVTTILQELDAPPPEAQAAAPQAQGQPQTAAPEAQAADAAAQGKAAQPDAAEKDPFESENQKRIADYTSKYPNLQYILDDAQFKFNPQDPQRGVEPSTDPSKPIDNLLKRIGHLITGGDDAAKQEVADFILRRQRGIKQKDPAAPAPAAPTSSTSSDTPFMMSATEAARWSEDDFFNSIYKQMGGRRFK